MVRPLNLVSSREAEVSVVRSANFELSVDGVPRSYRDRKDLALQSALFLKSRNPNSVVKLKDLQTGEEIVIAFKSGQQLRRSVNFPFSVLAGRTRVRK